MLGMDADAVMDVYWSNVGTSLESHGSNGWVDTSTQLSYVQPDQTTFNGIAETMQYPLSATPKRSQSLSAASTFNGFLDMLQDNSTTQPSSALTSCSSAVTEDDIGFDSSMQLCRELQEYCHYVSHRPSFTPSVYHNVFHDLLRMCTAASNMPPTAGHCPTAALVLAAMLKFLELCTLIISRLSENPVNSAMGAAHLQNMFLLKKMDLVLLPTKLYLAGKGHQAGVQKAQDLHHQIESTIIKEYPQLAWGDVNGHHHHVNHGDLSCSSCTTAR